MAQGQVAGQGGLPWPTWKAAWGWGFRKWAVCRGLNKYVNILRLMGTSFLIGRTAKREGFDKSYGVALELEVLVMLFDNLVKFVSLKKI